MGIGIRTIEAGHVDAPSKPLLVQTGPGGEAMINIGDYAQLKAICWNRRHDEPITAQAALAIYERNWDYVDRANLTAEETTLIEYLRETVGNGALCV